MGLHESAEMYLDTIYTLTKARGTVRSIDVAEDMGYSKPSVSRAVGLLKKGGYLIMEQDGSLVLTPAVEAVAKNVYERHTVLTAMLTRLGVAPETAAEDACRIEHVISEESFRAIREHIKL